MMRDTSSGVVVFRCACGAEEPGDPADARIASVILGVSETIEMYDNLIRSAPFDRTNQRVKRNCDECGLDYMTEIRVGPAETPIYRCKCGYKHIVGNKPAKQEARP